MSKRKFFKNLFIALKDDAKKKHNVTKETFKEVKDAYNICVEEEKLTNADFKEYSDAKGFKEKTKVISSHAKRNSKAALESAKKVLLHIKEMRKKRGQEEIIVEEELTEFDFELVSDEVTREENNLQIEGPTLVKKI